MLPGDGQIPASTASYKLVEANSPRRSRAGLRGRWGDWGLVVDRIADLVGGIGGDGLARLAQGGRSARMLRIVRLLIAQRDLACGGRSRIAAHLVLAVDLDRFTQRAKLDHHHAIPAEAHKTHRLRDVTVDPLLVAQPVGTAA